MGARPWKSGRALDLADLDQVDAVVMRLKLPPLREIELAEPEVLELQRARVERRELLDRLAAALADGAHRREELCDRPTRLRPDHLGGVRRAGRRRRKRRERGEIRGEARSGARRLGLARELRGQLPRRALREDQMMDDLTDRPVLLARLPVGLSLREPIGLAEDLGAHRLELGPQGFDGPRERHGDEYTSVRGADRACYSASWPIAGSWHASRGDDSPRGACTRTAGSASARIRWRCPTGRRRSTASWNAPAASACCRSATRRPSCWSASTATSSAASSGRCRPAP